MKKYFITVLVFLATTAAFAQKKHKHNQNPPPAKDSVAAAPKTPAPSAQPVVGPAKPKKDWSKVNLAKRAADHFMFTLGYDNWLGTSGDSISIKGFNHSEGFYFMYDFPFKTDPRFSIGAGIGIGSSNIYFNGTYPQVAAYTNQTLAFTQSSGGTAYKKFKLTTTFLEIPLELRFAVDPEHMDKSWKIAVGTKIGLMASAYTKAVDPIQPGGGVLAHVSIKESSKQFFSTVKFAPTLRVSKGVFGVYAQIQANSLIKAGAGPSVFPVSFGFVLSGL